jgi:hypothetical protein
LFTADAVADGLESPESSAIHPAACRWILTRAMHRRSVSIRSADACVALI